MGRGRKRNTELNTDKKEVHKKRKVTDDMPQWIEDPLSTTDGSAPCSYLGVRVEGEEIFLSETRHVRAFSGKEDEYTCEILKFYDLTATGGDTEMVADVRWYYQPTELKRSKVKNMPDKFLPNEVILSDDYSPVSVETITKKCLVKILDASKVPEKTMLNDGNLYCRWRLVKGEKHHLVPAIPVTPKFKAQSAKNSMTNTKTKGKRNTEVTSKTNSKKRNKRSTEKNSDITTKSKATVLKKKATEVKKALTKTSKVKHQMSSSPKKTKAKKNVAERCANREGITPFESARERLHVSAVPDSLPCRQEEYNEICSFVESRLLDHTGGCMYISGMPGTGKTATVLEVVKELEESSSDGDMPAFQFVHLNGLNLTNPQQVFQVILKQLTGKKSSPANALEALNQHFSNMDADTDNSILLLVDELDMLWTRRQTVYYSIFEWCTWPDTPLILLAIANTMDLPERMLIGRITSRLGLTRLNFLPYDFKQLMEILSARLGDLKMFEHDSIVLAARKVAAISGDARKALDICRRATEVAEKQGCSTVNTRHIDTVVKEMFFSPKVMAVKCASVQEQLLLQSVQADLIRLSSEETTLEQVYSTYCNHCSVKGVVHQLSLSELSSVCWRLADIRLLLLGTGRDVHQTMRLNISRDDLNYGLSL